MLKKILICTLITSHLYHQTNCSDATKLRIVYTDVIEVTSQGIQSDPIDFTNIKAKYPILALQAEIKAQFHVRDATMTDLMKTFTRQYQEKDACNTRMKNRIELLTQQYQEQGVDKATMKNLIEPLTQQYLAQEEIKKNHGIMSLQVLATTHEVLLNLLLQRAWDFKEAKCQQKATETRMHMLMLQHATKPRGQDDITE